MFDINLVPDKREFLITEETNICQLLKNELSKIWNEHTGWKFKANEVELQSNVEQKTKPNPRERLRETTEEAVKVEPRRGKMRQRNACYISFDNVGKDAPDSELALKDSIELFKSLNPDSEDEKASEAEASVEVARSIAKNHQHESNAEVISKDHEAHDFNSHPSAEIGVPGESSIINIQDTSSIRHQERRRFDEQWPRFHQTSPRHQGTTR